MRPCWCSLSLRQFYRPTFATVKGTAVQAVRADYGERDVSYEDKVAQVIRQLERGEARILFDPVSETVNIVVVERSGR